jgi:hypothetical protein
MATKRSRRETSAVDTPTDIPAKIPAPDTPDAAKAIIRRLMEQFNVEPAMLEDDDSGLSDLGLGVWCANKLT